MTFSLTSFNVHLNGMHHDKTKYYNLNQVMESYASDINVFQEIIYDDKEENNIFLAKDHNYIFHHLGDYQLPSLVELRPPLEPKPISLLFSTKFPILEHEILPLAHYGKDPRKSVLKVTCLIDNVKVDIFALHLTVGLLPLGSLLQLNQCRKMINPLRPTIFVGDHNLWDFIVKLVLPNTFKQAVNGATWPAKKPLHQIDQIFTQGFMHHASKVHPAVGSDHLAISATLSLG